MLPCFLCLLALAAPQDWYVDRNAASCATGTGGPGDPFCRITDAIGAASGGDTVHVAPGVYAENFVLDKDLVLIGTAGSGVTIVNGAQLGSVARVSAGTTCELEGLTLTNGRNDYGGGLLVDSAADQPLTTVTLRDSTVGNNLAYGTLPPPVASGGGGVAAFENSSVTLLRVRIRNNTAYSPYDGLNLGFATGGGVYNAGTMEVVECEITGNAWEADFGGGGSVYNSNPGTLNMRSSLVSSMRGFGPAGTIVTLGTMTLDHCTIAGNRDPIFDQANGPIINAGTQPVLVRGSVLWGNSPTGGGNQILDVPNVTVHDSNLEGGWSGAGTNNIALDPLFADPATRDFSLQPGSPSIDVGGPGAGAAPSSKGLQGNPRRLDGDLNRTMVIDMGAYEFSNVELTVTGNATPGGTLTFCLAGTPGLAARLIVASASSELVLSPVGTLFFDLTSPWFKFNAGTLPSSLPLTIPPTIPPGTVAVIQAFALGAQLPNGRLPLNFSNAVALTIQ